MGEGEELGVGEELSWRSQGLPADQDWIFNKSQAQCTISICTGSVQCVKRLPLGKISRLKADVAHTIRLNRHWEVIHSKHDYYLF